MISLKRDSVQLDEKKEKIYVAELHYYQLQYLIIATTFQFQKNIFLFSKNESEAIKEGYFKVFSLCRCKLEDINFRNIKEVDLPKTFSSQISRENRKMKYKT